MKLFRFAASVVFVLNLGACAPEVGSREWCEQMDNKPKGEWTANEATEYTKSCVF
ncbi:MAG: DUF3012 domain-containing protein [Gammaproteobacteria bacterium]